MQEKEMGTRSSGSNGKGKKRLGVEDMPGIGVDLGNNGSRNGSIGAVRKRRRKNLQWENACLLSPEFYCYPQLASSHLLQFIEKPGQ
jgi:hypothetical protein